MDIKKADPTQRLREATQETQTAEPKLNPKGLSEVQDSLEQVKQSDAFEQALASSNQDGTSKRDALDGLRIGSDIGVPETIQDALDNIPSIGSDGIVDAVQSFVNEVRTAPTTTVRSEQLETLKGIRIQLNELLQEAQTNNPIQDHVTEIRGPDVPANPVQAGDALDGFRFGADDIDEIIGDIQDILDRIPSAVLDDNARQTILDAFHALQGSSSEKTNTTGNTPTTTVRSEQINRIRTAVNQIVTGKDRE